MTSNQVYSKIEVITIPKSVNTPYRRIQNEINVESTKDPKLFKVYDGKTLIGSTRQEKDYWVIYGVFVEDHYNSMEEAVTALVSAYDFHLARVLTKREKKIGII